MGVVVPGPGFGRESGEQVAAQHNSPAPEWCKRDDNGTLWVFPPHTARAYPAPVPENPAPIFVYTKFRRVLADAKPNPKLITLALDCRGMDGPEVDEALGVADALDSVVDGWEDGTYQPSESDIRRLATLTSFMPSWFYGDDPPEAANMFACATGSFDREHRYDPDRGGPSTRRVHYGIAADDVTVPICGQNSRGPHPTRTPRVTGTWADVTCLKCASFDPDLPPL